MARRVLESSVKKYVTAYLLSLQEPDSSVQCYFRMPVPYGYGKSGLDYEGCINGYFFAVETKSPDEEADLTPRQRQTAAAIIRGGGKVFIISSREGMEAFQRWVSTCKSVPA